MITKDLAIEIANQWDALPSTVFNKELEASYIAFKSEVEQQYKELSKLITIIWTNKDPYKSSAEMFHDVSYWNRLLVYTEGEPNKFMYGEINIKFRAVHDYYGHFVNLYGFNFEGETLAFYAHAKMFSPLACKALISETIAQNCYFNFAPQNIGKKNSEREFAPQKTVLLPDYLLNQILPNLK